MRQIVPEQNLVYLSDGDSYTVDCSELVADNIAHVGEDQSGLWIERQPFDGRIRVFNTKAVNRAFERARAQRDAEETTVPETLSEAIDRRKSDVDNLRDQKIGSGLVYDFPDGLGTIQLRSQKDLGNVLGVASAGQALMAAGDTDSTINFRDSEDSTHALTGAELVQMGLAVATYISNHYGAAWSHKDAISDLATKDAVDSYDITTGWPA